MGIQVTEGGHSVSCDGRKPPGVWRWSDAVNHFVGRIGLGLLHRSKAPPVIQFIRCAVTSSIGAVCSRHDGNQYSPAGPLPSGVKSRRCTASLSRKLGSNTFAREYRTTCGTLCLPAGCETRPDVSFARGSKNFEFDAGRVACG